MGSGLLSEKPGSFVLLSWQPYVHIKLYLKTHFMASTKLYRASQQWKKGYFRLKKRKNCQVKNHNHPQSNTHIFKFGLHKFTCFHVEKMEIFLFAHYLMTTFL